MHSDVYKYFLPECYLDTILLETLLEKSFSINHRNGNSSIAVNLNDYPLIENFDVGIVEKYK